MVKTRRKVSNNKHRKIHNKTRKPKYGGGRKTIDEINRELQQKKRFHEWIDLGGYFGLTKKNGDNNDNEYLYFDVDDNIVNVYGKTKLYNPDNPDVNYIPIFTKATLTTTLPRGKSTHDEMPDDPFLYEQIHPPYFELATENDVMYQDELVCILKPEAKKGILVFSHYVQPKNMESLCKLGLKTGLELSKNRINYERVTKHPYIFFRAPFYSRHIDYSTVETEIISSYGEIYTENIYIRVDPTKTFIFSSEIRSLRPQKKEIERSKKLMTKYLDIIEDNQNTLETQKVFKNNPVYNLHTSKVDFFPNSTDIIYPFNMYNINRQSEILVSIPHLTPDFFVLCT
jgi:hypothetical protein